MVLQSFWALWGFQWFDAFYSIYVEKSSIFENQNWYRRILTMKKLDQKRKSQLTTFLSDFNPPLTRWIPARRPIKPVNKFSTCVQIWNSIYVRKTSGRKMRLLWFGTFKNPIFMLTLDKLGCPNGYLAMYRKPGQSFLRDKQITISVITGRVLTFAGLVEDSEL